jgi:hypothetical protein
MHSYIVYGAVELDQELSLDYDWMRDSFKYMDVFFNENVGFIYGVRCVLDPATGIASLEKEKKESYDEFMVLFRKKFPNYSSTGSYYTGVAVSDIDNLYYVTYDLDEDETEDEKTDEDETEEYDTVTKQIPNMSDTITKQIPDISSTEIKSIKPEDNDGIISPLGSYNIYGNAIRCYKCDSLYHVQKNCYE